MGDHLKKVQSGSPLVIPAPAYNAFIDTAVAHQARQNGLTQTATPTSQQSGIILVRNDSGDVDRFGVLGMGDPIILPADNEQVFKNRAAFAGVTPDADDHWNRYVITQEPIAAGKIGRAMAAGITAVKLDVLTANITTATLVNGEKTKLATGPGGSQILWRDEPPGGYGNEAWAKVLIGCPPGTFFGRVAKPENRTMDDCSWIRPATADNPPYVYVKHIAPGDTTTTGLVVTAATVANFLKVYLPAGTFRNPSGYTLCPPPEEPNVRQDDVISFVRDGTDYYGVDYPMDRPLGDEKLIFNSTLSPGLPRGWYYMENDTSVRMPNTALATLGAEITNDDIRQTLMVVNDENPDDWELPFNNPQGAVEVALPYRIEGMPSSAEGAMGSYHRLAQRVN